MSHSLTVPVSAKIRLCQPAPATFEFAQRLEHAGASWITLHARHVSARRRRQGLADLEQIKRLKSHLSIPVVSNGNVRTWEDVEANRAFTGADGIMVGESILENPCLFANAVPDPVGISLEYLDLCRQHPGTATIQTVQTHIRHFVDHRCGRRTWFKKFRAALNLCQKLDDIEVLLYKVQMWRGLSSPPNGHDKATESEDGAEEDVEAHSDTVEDVFAALSLLD